MKDRARNSAITKAWRAARYAERVLIEGRLVHPGAQHGTPCAYSNYGCRCVPCCDARRDYMQQWRTGRLRRG